MRRRVLITGATGFIGKHLCSRLYQDGFELAATFRRKPPESWPVPSVWIPIDDIGPTTDWSYALQNVSYVVHLAAIAHKIGPEQALSSDAYERVNHLGTRTLARAAVGTRSIKRFLHISSTGAVTNESDSIIDAATPCDPKTDYGRSKFAAEEAIRTTFKDRATEWCILRPTLVYGPGNPGNMERLIRLLRLGVPLPLGSVRNRRSLIFVGNLVDAIAIALDHPHASSGTFFVSDGEPVSTPNLLHLLAEASGKRIRLLPCPILMLEALGLLGSCVRRLTGRSVGIDLGSVRKLCSSLVVDDTPFRERCGWRSPFSILDGLRLTFK